MAAEWQAFAFAGLIFVSGAVVLVFHVELYLTPQDIVLDKTNIYHIIYLDLL